MAQDAGLSTMAMYSYFPSKQALLETHVRSFVELLMVLGMPRYPLPERDSLRERDSLTERVLADAVRGVAEAGVAPGGQVNLHWERLLLLSAELVP